MIKCSFCESELDKQDIIILGKEKICPVCGESIYLDEYEYSDNSHHVITREDLRKWGIR